MGVGFLFFVFAKVVIFLSKMFDSDQFFSIKLHFLTRRSYM